MIQRLRLHNFKCFEDLSLDFGALTLLTGLNSTGKSSVLQALLLLRQSNSGYGDITGLDLNGALISLGTTRDVRFEGATSDDIDICLTMSDTAQEFCWSFSIDRETDVLKRRCYFPPEDDLLLYGISLFSNDFHYLQAERLGPRTAFDVSDFQVRQHRQLGAQGQYTAHFLALFGNEDIPNPHLQHPQARTLSLKNQVEAWIGEISPGTRLNLTDLPDVDLVSLRFSFVTGKQESDPYRPTNVGFGLSYTLPIIVAILSAKPGALVLLENPEAHLHPRGQAMIGELLARAAHAGVQIVLESHSDHVLNGIRVAVHGGKIPPEEVKIHFFGRDLERGTHTVVSPQIDRNGRIDQWPAGFFDEWDKSLEILLEPRSDA